MTRIGETQREDPDIAHNEFAEPHQGFLTLIDDTFGKQVRDAAAAILADHKGAPDDLSPLAVLQGALRSVYLNAYAISDRSHPPTKR